MKTIQAIKLQLRETNEREPWMEELTKDSRKGVQQALNSWNRAYDKRCVSKADHIGKQQFDLSFAPFEGAKVAGTDEAGRGPLAGPVVTAAVILPLGSDELIGLDDSKQISKKERERLAEIIKRISLAWSVHVQPAERIDEINIYAATRESMEQAIRTLPVEPDQVLSDAMPLTANCPAVSIVKGDAKSLAIAAASILAKTTRDQLMDELHEEYPMYRFDNHAGYGTPEHLRALENYGPSVHHRKTFEPIKTMIARKAADL
ncbi:ribonuclease HII [Sporosarcina gallistercoris]|uniref:ribonuclease HII n=1 Tax=Sporosarcina gallistercoris TaxID=2762245 RepID=UPI003D2D4FAE